MSSVVLHMAVGVLKYKDRRPYVCVPMGRERIMVCPALPLTAGTSRTRRQGSCPLAIYQCRLVCCRDCGPSRGGRSSAILRLLELRPIRARQRRPRLCGRLRAW